jgi:hypothetical protein
MTKLNTGWKYWDIYLSKFVGKKINCLDIGAYKGETTCWMLNNLCSNPYSRVYSIGTWKGEPDSIENTFYSEVEKRFDKNIEKTGRSEQNIKLKMTSSQALIELRNEGDIFFDFIYIDASCEFRDIFADGILSWVLLTEGGIMIFDDYKGKIYDNANFTPRMAVDSFVYIFKPQLKTLYSGWQYIVEKINKRDSKKPALNNLYNLIDDINYWKIDNITEVFEDDEFGDIKNTDLEFKLVMSKKKPEYLTKETEKYLEQYLFYLNHKYPNVVIYTFSHLFDKTNPIDIIKNTLKDKISKNTELFINATDYQSFVTDENESFNIFKLVEIYIKNNFLITETNINMFFITRKTLNEDVYDKIIKYFKKKYDLKTNLDVYTINDKNNVINNFNDINNIIKNINTKYDIINLKSLFSKSISIRKTLINKNVSFEIEQFYKIYLCLALQKVKGNALFHFRLNLTNINIEFIYLLKKYYKKVVITNTIKDSYYISISSLAIECYDFMGISKRDLMELKKIGLEITKKNNNFSYFDNENYYFLHSIIKINKKDYELIKNKIIKYNLKKIKLNIKYLDIMERIEDYIHNKNNDNKNINLLKNTIYKKQISDFVYMLFSIK